MTSYLLRRLAWLVPTLLAIALIAFVIMHATPGGPWDRELATRPPDPGLRAALDRQFGLDKPLFFNFDAAQAALAARANPLQVVQSLLDAQFFLYLDHLAHGDLGPSFRFRGRAVQEIIFEAAPGRASWQSRFMLSALLGLAALTLALLTGVPLGLASGFRPNSSLDRAGLVVATLGYGIPSFIMGLLLIYVFSVWLGLFPVLDADLWESARPWVLPILALALPTSAYLARLTRASVIDVLRQDYVRTARAKGLPESVVAFRHVLRNALLPVVTFSGPALAALVTGSFIIEQQFRVNGIGLLFVESISRRDYGVVLALTLLYALLIVLANLAVDMAYGLLDPRLRPGRAT